MASGISGAGGFHLDQTQKGTGLMERMGMLEEENPRATEGLGVLG